MKRQKRIVLITSGQPSLNPRLVKEADALATAGYHVTVLYAYWNDWGDGLDATLLATRKWQSVCAGGNPKNEKVIYFFSRLIHKLAKSVTRIGLFGCFSDFAIARSSKSLISTAKKYPADLYIGHNLGALPAVIKTAKLYNARSGFDAEDFHRQEISDDKNSNHYKVVKHAEDKYFKYLDFMTASSPQIADAYKKLYPNLNLLTILNVFPVSYRTQTVPYCELQPIKLFWFSQTIGFNRGLNDIAKALRLLKSTKFELHLLGYLAKERMQGFIEQELNGIGNIFFYEPVPPDELIDFASKFDIGLALEPAFCKNNDIALSNKLFTYLQAGLAVIATDTKAQKYFLEKHPQIGHLYPKGNIEALTNILTSYMHQPGKLKSTCIAALNLGQTKLNWEVESKYYLEHIKGTLSSN